jgi:hypothetical protein
VIPSLCCGFLVWKEKVLVGVFFDDGSRLIFSRAVTKVAITAYHKKGIIINSKIYGYSMLFINCNITVHFKKKKNITVIQSL